MRRTSAVLFAAAAAAALSCRTVAVRANPAAASGAPPARVRWVASTAEAFARAKETGRPVLLLHLFGRLDEEFC